MEKMRQQGASNLQTQQDQAASQRQADELHATMRFKLLDQQMALAQNPNAPQAMRAAAADNAQKLAKAAGLGPDEFTLAAAGSTLGMPVKDIADLAKNFDSASVQAYLQSVHDGNPNQALLKPKAGKATVVNPGGKAFDEDGKLIAENTGLTTAQAIAGKPVVLAPGSIAASPGGGIIAQNDKARPIAMDRRIELVKPTVDAAQKAYDADPTSLEAAAKLVMANDDLRTAQGLNTAGANAKARAELQDQVAALKTFDQANNRIVNILQKDPDAGLAAGSGATFGRRLKDNAESLIHTLGIQTDDGALRQSTFDADLTKIAGDNAALKAATFGVAVQYALGTGIAKGRFSNDDLKQALNAIGANGTITKANLVARLKEARTVMATQLTNKLGARLGQLQTSSPDFSSLTGDKGDASRPDTMPGNGGTTYTHIRVGKDGQLQ